MNRKSHGCPNGMFDADIDDIAIEIPDKIISKHDEPSSNSGKESIHRRKMSNTAMDIYSEIRSKKEEELLDIIEEKNNKITDLQKKIVTLENAIKETSEKEQDRGKKKRKLAESCNNESNAHENLQTQVENLTSRLCERENELHEAREKLAESEWKESSEIERLTKEVNQLKKQDSLKPIEEPTEVNWICKKIQTMIGERMDKLEEKIVTIEKKQTVGGREILQAVNTVTDQQAATYASILSGNVSLSQTPTNEQEAVNLKDIMRQSRNEDIQEEAEKRKRDCSSAVHGVDQNVEPSEYIDNLIKTLAISVVKPKAVKRVGNGEKRPLIVTFQNTEEKSKFMKSLSSLKWKNEYQGLRITDDYTMNERNLIRKLSDQAKQKNIQEGSNADFSWRVRGSSKNGFRIMKIYKKQN